MIKTVKQACRFNPIIRDYRMSQGIENLADLINMASLGSDQREPFPPRFHRPNFEPREPCAPQTSWDAGTACAST